MPATATATATATLAQEANDAVARLVKVAVCSHRQAPRAHDRVDQAALTILFKLLDGPRRVSALAELTYTDVSTASRHVTHLVRQGLADKLPDPADGRAYRVTLSASGRELVGAAKAAAAERMRHVLADWTDAEVRSLVAMLARLADDLDSGMTRPQTP
jgi:DNA-binding MarR family transcriptional regulator